MGFFQVLRERAAAKKLARMAEDENYLLLRHSDLCQDLSDSALLFLTRRLMERFYARGELVCRQGNPGVCMYLLKRGSVEFSYTSQGRRVVVGQAKQGSLFGELSVLTDSERGTTVKADENDTVLLALSRFDLALFKERYPRDLGVLFSRILRISLRRLHALASRYHDLLVKLGDWSPSAREEGLILTPLGTPKTIELLPQSSDQLAAAILPQLPSKSSPNEPRHTLEHATASAWFRDWSTSRQKALLKELTRITLAPGEQLSQDKLALCIVQEGELHLTLSKRGRDLSFGVIPAQMFFGNIALLFDMSDPAIARASEATTLWTLSYESFQKLLQNDPKMNYPLLHGILLTVAHNLRRFNRQLKEAEGEWKRREDEPSP